MSLVRSSVALCAAGVSLCEARLTDASARQDTAVPATAASAAGGDRTKRNQTIAARFT